MSWSRPSFAPGATVGTRARHQGGKERARACRACARVQRARAALCTHVEALVTVRGLHRALRDVLFSHDAHQRRIVLLKREQLLHAGQLSGAGRDVIGAVVGRVEEATGVAAGALHNQNAVLRRKALRVVARRSPDSVA